MENNSKKHLTFYFKIFILRVVLVIKRNVMITEQIRTLEYIQEFLVYKIVVNFFRNSVSKLMRTKK